MVTRHQLITITTAFFLSGCIWDSHPKPNDKLRITNRSEHAILCYTSRENVVSPHDLEDPTKVYSGSIFEITEIKPFATESLAGSSFWAEDAERGVPDSAITIFFFDKDMVKKKGWAYVLARNAFLKSESTTVDELNGRGWHLVFK